MVEEFASRNVFRRSRRYLVKMHNNTRGAGRVSWATVARRLVAPGYRPGRFYKHLGKCSSCRSPKGVLPSHKFYFFQPGSDQVQDLNDDALLLQNFFGENS